MEDLEIHFHPELEKSIKALNYDDFTSVQKKIMPCIQNKENVLAITDYGEGKTASFILPILDRILREGNKNLSSIIITPTRGLIFKVKKSLERYTASLDINFFAFTRDYFSDDIEEHLNGKQILIATAEQLAFLNEQLDFSHIHQLVIDDFSLMEFFGHLNQIETFFEKLNRGIQVTVYSHSLTERLSEFVQEKLLTYKQIEIEKQDIELTELKHMAYDCKDFDDKLKELKNVLKIERNRRIMLFANEDWKLRKIANMLKKELQIPCRYLDLDKENNLSKDIKLFLEGVYHVLILQNFKDQDLHIHEANQMINFDLPEQSDIYKRQVDMLSRRAKLYNENAIINFISLEHYAPVKHLSDELAIEFVQKTVVKETLEYGRATKERIRKRRLL